MVKSFWFKQGIAVLGLIAFTSTSNFAIARDGISGSSSTSLLGSTTVAKASSETETTTSVEVEHHEAETEAAKLHSEAKTAKHLDENKMKSCVKVEAKIKEQTESLVKRAQHQLEVFDKASLKVQAFAVDKKLTVTDEAKLLADVKTARAKVEADLVILKADSAAFKCDAANPKGQIQAFKASAKLIRTDLKAYRLAVRQLIQGIRKANGQHRTDTKAKTGETETEAATTSITNSITGVKQ